jgi:hypothetical protein
MPRAVWHIAANCGILWHSWAVLAASWLLLRRRRAGGVQKAPAKGQLLIDVHVSKTSSGIGASPLLVGKLAYCVAVDGGSPGGRGDRFSVLITASDAHEPLRCPSSSEI